MSEIIDFYPINFKLDVNGAAFAWMGVNLLPFIDRARLLKAMQKADEGYKNLKPDERERNKRTGDIYLFINKQNLDVMKLENLDSESAEDRLSK